MALPLAYGCVGAGWCQAACPGPRFCEELRTPPWLPRPSARSLRMKETNAEGLVWNSTRVDTVSLQLTVCTENKRAGKMQGRQSPRQRRAGFGQCRMRTLWEGAAYARGTGPGLFQISLAYGKRDRDESFGA